MPPRKKGVKVVQKPVESAGVTESPEIHEFGLQDFLSNMGKNRISVKNMLIGIGIHNSVEAYSYFCSIDYIPSILTPEQFNIIYQELMA